MLLAINHYVSIRLLGAIWPYIIQGYVGYVKEKTLRSCNNVVYSPYLSTSLHSMTYQHMISKMYIRYNVVDIALRSYRINCERVFI
jgi:hypothetical protein